MTTNKMQLFGLFIYSQSALHVLGDVFSHHREHLTVFIASDIVHQYCCQLLSWMRDATVHLIHDTSWQQYWWTL